MKLLKKGIQIVGALIFLQLGACDSSSSKGKPQKVLFTDVTKEAGLTYKLKSEPASPDGDREAGGVAVGDINGDGYQDFFVAHGVSSPGRLFLNNKDGSFKDITS